MLSEKRILRLAEKYGPNVRFFAEGSEGKDEESALDGAIKDGEKAERTPEEQRAIDKARLNEQQLEQEKANTTRANETARQAQSDLEEKNSENETLREKLAEAETKAAQAGIKNIELDESEYQGTDLNLVRAINSLKQEQTVKDTEIKALKDKAAGYEERDRKEQVKLARNSAFQELLTDLDSEYGANCRNDAVKKFNEMCDKGEVTKGNPAKATRAMEKCYKEVKEAKAKETKKSLTLDTGSGGGDAPNLSETKIKSGQSLDEATAQLAAAAKTS